MKITDVYPSYYKYIPRSWRDIKTWLKLNCRLIRVGTHERSVRLVVEQNTRARRLAEDGYRDHLAEIKEMYKNQLSAYKDLRVLYEELRLRLEYLEQVRATAIEVAGRFGPHTATLADSLNSYNDYMQSHDVRFEEW